jgi:hypothetical protein
LFFQVLDEKRECGTVFFNGELVDSFAPGDMTHTWSYSPQLDSFSVEYLNIWTSGATLSQCCPEELQAEWRDINERAKSFINAIKVARINLADNCLFDLLPDSFLLQFYDLKNKITSFVYENYEKPKNYDFLADVVRFIYHLEREKLNLKFENLDFTNKKIRNNFGKIKTSSGHVKYSPWKTSTGRLSTMPGSFPILNLNKELRPAVCPTNDALVEFDYNAAELRVLFALLSQEQPDDDIHAWVSKNIFDGKYDRDTTKKKVFSWLYNPKAKNKKLNNFLNREEIFKKFYHDGKINTPFDREISVEEDKAVNYTIQSTTSDLFLSSAIKIDRILKNKKSKVAFCVHDSLVIDMAEEDREILDSLVREFSNTRLGAFKTNISIGKNYGAMRKVQ